MATDKQAAVYLGKAVEVARVERGMKRTELEERTTLSYAYLSEIEKGRKYPSQAAIAKLAEALDISPFELLSRAERLERGAAQDPFAAVDGSLGFVVQSPQPMLTPPAEGVVARVSAEVYRTVEPRMREWLMREIQLAVREELLRQRETR